MINGAKREIPENIPGLKQYVLYNGADTVVPTGRVAGKKLRTAKPGQDKVLDSIETAVRKTGLVAGQTISFHHHFRDGDYIIKMVLEAIKGLGIKDLTLAGSSLSDCHDFLVDYIQDGTISAIETSGLRGKLGKFVTANPGVLKKPVIIRSHGGRARAICSGEVKIDVAFLGVPTCDKFGNATGTQGKSICGALGYAMVDAQYAEQVVLLTDNLLEGFVYPYSIEQTLVDYIVPVPEIGDSNKISSGALRITRDPVQLLLAEYAAEVIEQSGYFVNGYSLQMGSGGASLAAARFIREKMLKQEIKGSFGIGGSTGVFTDMLAEGLFETFYDTQTFDIPAILSLRDNPRHQEISASFYANPWNASPIVNNLDIVILSATEVDLDFNVNVMTNSNGVLMGASGGHSDTAAGAKLSIIVVPLIRGRLPMIKDQVQNVITPGADIDIVITDYGIAINPLRTDLLERFKNSKLPLKTMQELQALAYSLVGKPEEIELTDQIVAVIEYRDGSLLDVVRKPK
ncbi:citrate lyase subunit alpha [Succinispira mobilis]|uniref:citrate lyase subunit alpha n=1 Tax=Succinispira mobilis TaxID=78120 RepID=UPI000370723E|nr:citrate lyase subunit alpha [Succinispira mobilis]